MLFETFESEYFGIGVGERFSDIEFLNNLKETKVREVKFYSLDTKFYGYCFSYYYSDDQIVSSGIKSDYDILPAEAKIKSIVLSKDETIDKAEIAVSKFGVEFLRLLTSNNQCISFGQTNLALVTVELKYCSIVSFTAIVGSGRMISIRFNYSKTESYENEIFSDELFT